MDLVCQVDVDFACEIEKFKQINLVQNVIGPTNRSTCVFEDATLMASEKRLCVRHKKACDHWPDSSSCCHLEVVFLLGFGL